MNRYVYLKPSEPRCDPRVTCHRSASCARALVSHVGRPVEDFTAVNNWSAGNCKGFLDASQYHDAPKDEKPAKDYVKGLI